MPRELKLFILTTIAYGTAISIYNSIFSNFLDDTLSLSATQRTFLEFPRELPGLLLVIFTSLFSALCSRRLGVLAMILNCVGAIVLGFFSKSFGIMCVWLFIFSLGDHLFLPVNTTISMELAKDGHTGERLGQLNSIKNAATIFGAFLVMIGFKFLDFTYQKSFILAGIGFLLAAALLLSMKRSKPAQAKSYFKIHKEYRLYYLMAVLYGTRKQVFLTFAPWVIVTIFHKPTEVLATLMTIGGVIGILFQPFLGHAIDKFGEKKVLMVESFSLIFVCLFYGFSPILLGKGNTAFLILCVCYLLDQMLFSVSIARNTYLKKIAVRPEDIQPTITTGISMDHVFSISAALIGGIVWDKIGFEYVFLFGAFVALCNFVVATRIRVTKEAV